MTAAAESWAAAEDAPASMTVRARLLALVACGGAFEAVLLIGWLRPLSLWRTPTNLPAGAPMVPILGQTVEGAVRFLVPAAGLTALWVAALVIATALRGRLALAVSLGFTGVFLLTLLPMNPGGTQDIYHNVFDGRLFWLYGINPTIVPPQAYPDDPFAAHVWGYADLPSAYGPIWYLLTGLPTALAGDGLVANVIAQKLLVAVFSMFTVVAVVLAVRAVEPRRMVAAAVLAGWCPLLVWETAGNGHNDSVMTFFLALALLAATRRAYPWVLPLLTLSVLVKYTTALAVPVALVWLWRRPDVSSHQIAVGIGVSLLLAVVLFAPMYAGADTIAATRRPGMTFILSPATLLYGWLVRSWSIDDASRITQAITGVVFAAGYVLTLARTRGDVLSLAARCFDVLLLYLLLVSWWFWPWYVLWLAPLAPLTRGYGRVAAFAAFAGAALLMYVYWWPDPLWPSRRWFLAYATMTVGVFLPAALIWLGTLMGAERRSRLREVAR